MDINITNESCQNTSVTNLHHHLCFCQKQKCMKSMDEKCRNFEFGVSFVLVGVTCLFGFIGNILSILTLKRDSVKSVTTFLLSALAVADFAFLVPAVFVIMIPTYCEIFQHCIPVVVAVIPYIEQYGWAVTGACHTCTIYVTVLVAIHRYLWVCRPDLVERFSGLYLAQLQVTIIPICALFYNFPIFFEYRIVTFTYYVEPSKSNYSAVRTETTKEFTSIGKNKYYQILYKNACFFIVMYLIPLAILTMVSFYLLKTLQQRRATLQRIGSIKSNCSQRRRDDSITFVLIIIIVSFIICQTPAMLQRLVLALAGDIGHACGHPYFYLEHFAEFMLLLNSSTNFVIYILFSSHFRKTLLHHVLHKGGQNSRTSHKNSSCLSRSRKQSSRSSENKNRMNLQELNQADDDNMAPGPNSNLIRSNHASEETCNPGWQSPQDVDGSDKSGIGYTSQTTQTTSVVYSMSGDNIVDNCAKKEQISTKEIIEQGESDFVEFKSTLRWNIHSNRKDKAIENASLKTLAAFMNAQGGTLIIGVADDGRILGLETDKFANHDKLLLHLTKIIQDRIGDLYIKYLHFSIENTLSVCELRI